MTIIAREGLHAEAIKKGYSMTSLAKKTGRSRVQIGNIIHGGKTSPETAKLIADALGKEVEELFYIV